MTPLDRLYARRKISNHDLYMAQCMPLMHKRLLLEGKSSNKEIDVLFELMYRLVCLSGMSGNKQAATIAKQGQLALVAACDNAANKGQYRITPSTDQKKAICLGLDTLAKIAPQLTNELYHISRIYGEHQSRELISKGH